MSTLLENKMFDFSIRIAELVRYLREENKDFPLCERLLSCGVSGGLALKRSKMEEAAAYIEEVDYIIEMAVVAGYITKKQSSHICADCDNLLKELCVK